MDSGVEVVISLFGGAEEEVGLIGGSGDVVEAMELVGVLSRLEAEPGVDGGSRSFLRDVAHVLEEATIVGLKGRPEGLPASEGRQARLETVDPQRKLGNRRRRRRAVVRQ